MKDRYSRKIDYLRISLTDECNLKCVYCRDDDKEYKEILSVDNYKFIIKNFSELGVTKIKFVGGEPLLYPHLGELISYAKHECNIEDVSITTNGQNFCEKALELRESGLDRVNIKIDSLKSFKYEAVTRGGNLNEALNTLNTCLKLKLAVKINCLLIDEYNVDEIDDFIRIAKYNDVDIRFIELIPWSNSEKLYDTSYINVTNLMKSRNLSPVKDNRSSNTIYYDIDNLKGRVGSISAMSNCFCDKCNKVIITNDGFIKLCMYGEKERDLKEYLHKPIMFKEVIKDIIEEKQVKYELV